MTLDEFYFQVERLKKTFGENKFPDERCATIYEVLRDMDAEWFRKTVTGVIIANDQYFNFAEAAKYERNSKASIRFADDVIKAAERLKDQITDQGMDKALSKFGANSLIEAVENSTKKPERWDQR